MSVGEAQYSAVLNEGEPVFADSGRVLDAGMNWTGLELTDMIVVNHSFVSPHLLVKLGRRSPGSFHSTFIIAVPCTNEQIADAAKRAELDTFGKTMMALLNLRRKT